MGDYMRYYVTDEEVIMSCVEKNLNNPNSTKSKIIVDKLSASTQNTVKEEVNKFRQDGRVRECPEGYYVCNQADKEGLEKQYDITWCPLYLDDIIK